MSRGCGINQEGQHSFQCWGAWRKLADYRFQVGHRLHEAEHGEAFRKRMLELEGAHREAKLHCGVCSPVGPGNTTSKPHGTVVECTRDKFKRDPPGHAKHRVMTAEGRRSRRSGRRKGDKRMGTAVAEKVSMAQAFRDIATEAVKGGGIRLKKVLPADEAIIAHVTKASGKKTFDAKMLAWYKSQVKANRLAKKGKASDN